MPLNLKGRIASGIVVNAIGKLWVLIIQLACVPILTQQWGASAYGVWLMLSTVPTYVALGGLGFGSAAATDMNHKVAQGDRNGALRVFQSVWLLMTAVMIFIFAVCLIGWIFQQIWIPYFPLALRKPDVINAALILVIYSIVTMQMSIISTAYQSVGRYAQGTFIFDAFTPIEAVAIISVSVNGGGMTDVAIAMTGARVIGVVFIYALLRFYEPWFRIGIRNATKYEAKRLAHPAMAALTMTLSSSLSLQGVVVSLGLFVSPVATAVFSTSRLLTRIPLQLVSMTSRATLPEMAAAFVRDDKTLSAKLAAVNLGFTGIVVVPATVLYIFAGPRILMALSKNHLHAEMSLFLWLALAAGFQAFWNTIAQFLFAMNMQQKFAYHYLLLALLVAASPVALTHYSVLTDVAALYCLAEAVIFVHIYKVWREESQLPVSELFRGFNAVLTQLLETGRVLIKRSHDCDVPRED
jgi:O-antigen/teichoic acid export membrane protein